MRQAALPFQPCVNVCRRLKRRPPPLLPPNCQPWNHLRSSERLLLNAPQALVESSANIVPVPSVHASQPVCEGRCCCAEAEGALIGWLPDMDRQQPDLLYFITYNP